MSKLGSIDYQLEKPLTIDFFSSILKNSVWKFENDGQVSFVPDDSGDFDWEWKKASQLDQILVQLSTRMKQGKDVGISLVSRDEESGGMLIYFQRISTLSLLINCNRRVLIDTNSTDFLWYVEKFDHLLDEYVILRREFKDS